MIGVCGNWVGMVSMQHLLFANRPIREGDEEEMVTPDEQLIMPVKAQNFCLELDFRLTGIYYI